MNVLELSQRSTLGIRPYVGGLQASSPPYLHLNKSTKNDTISDTSSLGKLLPCETTSPILR